MQWISPSNRVITLTEGDITKIAVDVIVNAANSALAGGGGVDGAIHKAGGPAIRRELEVIRRRIGRCPTGSAVATAAGLLPARYVFHAVGPLYRDGHQGEPGYLAACYHTCLEMAEEMQLATISFPAISTGVYGYPLEEAARIALREVKSHLTRPDGSVREVIFVLFGQPAFQAYAAIL